jgi:hypothetical protein
MDSDEGSGQGCRVVVLMASEQEQHTDAVVLEILLDDPRLYSVDEVEREIGSREARDGLNRLHAGGLIHRLDNFVWATRAAIKAEEIQQ